MATTPSDPASGEKPGSPIDNGERRLHPFSWLFVLITKLRPMLFPILVLLFLGRGERWELFGALGAVALSVYSLVYSFSFRYRIGRDALLVREGIFSRTERHVPFSRIQNIVQHRNLLHRLFAVTELRLESAGGNKPEAVMSVISAAEAKLIEQTLRGGSNDSEQSSAIEEIGTALHHAKLGEILRFGLSSNRGAIVVGAGFAAASQMQFWEAPQFKQLGQTLFGSLLSAVGGFGGWLSTALAIALGLLAMAIVLKLLSILMCLLSHYDFRLVREDERIGTVAGLLTRSHASANLSKLQRIIISQPWLARRMGRQGLTCEIASGQQAELNDSNHRLSYLVPMGTEAEVASVLAQVAPGLHPDRLTWQPLHPRAWRRRLLPSVLLLSVLLPLGLFFLGAWVWAAWLALVCLSVVEARRWAEFAGYAFDGELFAFRAGWLSRSWTVARVEKGQSLILKQSPFDRRHAMASVRMDTAGASSSSFALKVPYLSYDEALRLFNLSSRAVAASADPTAIARVSA